MKMMSVSIIHRTTVWYQCDHTAVEQVLDWVAFSFETQQQTPKGREVLVFLHESLYTFEFLCVCVGTCAQKIKGNPDHKGGQQCDSKALLATEPRNVLRPQARGSRLPRNNHMRVNIGPAGQRLNACRSQDIGGLQPDIEEMSQRLEVFCYVFFVPESCFILVIFEAYVFPHAKKYFQFKLSQKLCTMSQREKYMEKCWYMTT